MRTNEQTNERRNERTQERCAGERETERSDLRTTARSERCKRAHIDANGEARCANEPAGEEEKRKEAIHIINKKECSKVLQVSTLNPKRKTTSLQRDEWTYNSCVHVCIL